MVSFYVNQDGSINNLPEKDYSGVVTFIYHATDGALNSNAATVTITVNEGSALYLPMIIR